MKCYICTKTHHPGGFPSQVPAVGICHDCGIGLCQDHARRPAGPGTELLCADCETRRLATREIARESHEALVR